MSTELPEITSAPLPSVIVLTLGRTRFENGGLELINTVTVDVHN